MSSARVTDQKPGLVGVLADARGPVHRALGAQPPEQLVRRPVEPQLPLADETLVDVDVLGVAAGRSHIPSLGVALTAILLAGWPTWKRVINVTRARSAVALKSAPRGCAGAPCRAPSA